MEAGSAATGLPQITMEYNEWIKGIFATKREGLYPLKWEDEVWDDNTCSLPPGEVLDLIATTFSRAGEDLRPFSDEQVASGLNFITNECQTLLYNIYEVHVETSQRLAVINGVYVLYRDCLALRCSNDPAAEAKAENPLDIYAYMFWDASALSIYSVLKHNLEAKNELTDAILNVLENTLKLPNAMCQRAAIHGLGHSVYHVDSDSAGEHRTKWLQRIYKIIDFYCGLSTTHESLRQYACQARTGMIN
jgi:hypothetical protein